MAEGASLEIGLGVVPGNGLFGVEHLCPASLGHALECCIQLGLLDRSGNGIAHECVRGLAFSFGRGGNA